MGAEMLILIRARQRATVGRFEAAGAVSPETARTLEAIGEPGGWVFNDLARREVVRRVGADRWYLSSDGRARFEARQGRTAVIALVVVGVSLAVIAALVLARVL